MTDHLGPDRDINGIASITAAVKSPLQRVQYDVAPNPETGLIEAHLLQPVQPWVFVVSADVEPPDGEDAA